MRLKCFTSRKPVGLVTAGIILAALLLLLETLLVSAQPPSQAPTPTTAPAMIKTPGLILPELPSDASQVDYGWQAYRLVCSACHAYDGKGLTADWISTWDPADQNCWRSKCHSANHPPDGFELPHYVPEIVGPGELDRFGTAQDLFNYISTAMPWQDPGYLTDKEYWDISAYLVKANGFTLPAEPLSEGNASSLLLGKSQASVASPAPAASQPPAEASAPASLIKLVAAILAGSAVLAGLYAFFILRRKE